MILQWLLGGGLNGISKQLRGAYQDRLNAKNDEARIAADVTISQLEARQAVLARGGMFTPLVQALWAAPFIAYNAKIIVWDKMLGFGVTDPLGPFESDIGMIIVGFYFLTTGVRSLLK